MAIDPTLRQLLSEILECHREIDALRKQIAERDARIAKLHEQGTEKSPPTSDGSSQ